MLTDVLKQNLIKSMKDRDTDRVSVLRYLSSAIKNKEIALRGQGIQMEDKHIVKTVAQQIKQRNDSIEAYKSGNRQDLVDKESKELAILEEILDTFSSQVNE